MPRLKVLGSNEVISILRSFGFDIYSQKGSHIKLIRKNFFPKQILIIPNHKNISKGTLKAIYDQVSKYVSQEKIRDYFYSK